MQISFDQNTLSYNQNQNLNNIMQNLDYNDKQILKQALNQVPGEELPKILKALNQIPVDEHYVKSLINEINSQIIMNKTDTSAQSGFTLYA